MKKYLSLLSIALLSLAAAAQNKSKITLEDIWQNKTFNSKSIHGLLSMKDGNHYTTLEYDGNNSNIVQYSYQTGLATDTVLKYDMMIPAGESTPVIIDDYKFSMDEQKIMISAETESIYRHSTMEKNYVWDRKDKKLSALSEGAKQSHATFSPAGSKVAFVRENNLFIKDILSGEETQVTTDGKYNHVINGSADWVYEEEFAFDKAFFWSPDASSIAFYRFDESGVKEFQMAMYGELYPKQYSFKYPKAGEKNSKVSIHIYHINTKKTVDVDLGNDYEYVPRIKWTEDPGKLAVFGLNRHQNKLDILLAGSNDGKTETILTETSDTYIEINDDLVFLKNKKHFILTSEKDGFNHIYMYDIKGGMIRQITKGNWEVTQFLGIDEKTQKLYYVSAETSPMERNLFTIGIDGQGKKKLSERKGNNAVDFSAGHKYYINYHSDANTPSFISLHDASGKQIRVLESNSELLSKMQEYDISQTQFFNFKTSEGVALNGWMIKPPDFDASKKYPVLIHVYGGPGAQTVEDAWSSKNYFWHQLLAQRGYIVVSVDNRGTGARGRDFRVCTYKELGKLETTDQIEAAKYLGSLPYVDKTRIGIWGWSYGGYMTSLCLTKGADYFRMGIAVAPVTNWRFYDTIYTERYMQTPQENPGGYDENSPVNHVAKLKGKYLLVHGAADDNVHYQNSMEMVSALVAANKQFDLFIYPNKNHAIYGGSTRLHLYTMMTNFVIKNL